MDVHQKTVVADPTRSLLERADCILGAFDANHRTLSLPGLIARSGLPKTTVYRSLRKMTEMGWVDYYDGRYSIGGRIFEFASVALVSGVALRESALPALYSAIRQTVASQDDGNGLGRLPCGSLIMNVVSPRTSPVTLRP